MITNYLEYLSSGKDGALEAVVLIVVLMAMSILHKIMKIVVRKERTNGNLVEIVKVILFGSLAVTTVTIYAGGAGVIKGIALISAGVLFAFLIIIAVVTKK
jgi:hypothetical protein